MLGQCSYHKTANHIHGERSNREADTPGTLDGAAKEISDHTADRATKGNPDEHRRKVTP